MLANKLYIADYMKNYHKEIANLLNNGLEVNSRFFTPSIFCVWRSWSMQGMWIISVTGWETKSGSKLWTGKEKKVSMRQRMNHGAWPQVCSHRKYQHKIIQLFKGETAGRLRTYQNFQFLQVYEAGHMVPMDRPQAASEMLNSWLEGSLALKNHLPSIELVWTMGQHWTLFFG